MNIFADHPSRYFFRQDVLRVIGHEVMPHISQEIKNKYVARFDLAPEINYFYGRKIMDSYLPLGKSSACLTQEYNHIPGFLTLCNLYSLYHTGLMITHSSLI